MTMKESVTVNEGYPEAVLGWMQTVTGTGTHITLSKEMAKYVVRIGGLRYQGPTLLAAILAAMGVGSLTVLSCTDPDRAPGGAIIDQL